MRYESSDVVNFDLGPLLQDQTRIVNVKSAYNSLIKMLFIFKTILVLPLQWIQLAFGHRCVLGLVIYIVACQW